MDLNSYGPCLEVLLFFDERRDRHVLYSLQSGLRRLIALRPLYIVMAYIVMAT